MKTAYDIRQKISLMAIALGISLLLLGFNTCQKAQAVAGRYEESLGKTIDKVVAASREVAGETMEKAKDTATATCELGDTAGEETAEAYHASNTTGQAVSNLINQVIASKTNS